MSISFDDALANPLRRTGDGTLGVASTFFVLPGSVAADRRAWTGVLDRGHEISNHTGSHPCNASLAWSRDHPLEPMTLAEMRRELLAVSAQIRRLLGVDPWVFAYPRGQTFVARGPDPELRPRGGRVVRRRADVQ